MLNNTKVKITAINAQEYRSKNDKNVCSITQNKKHSNEYSRIQNLNPQQWIFTNTKVKAITMNVQQYQSKNHSMLYNTKVKTTKMNAEKYKNKKATLTNVQ